MLISVLSIMPRRAMAGDETGVRDFVTRWNAAYTGLNAKALASLETPDFEIVDRFGLWIKSEGRSSMSGFGQWDSATFLMGNLVRHAPSGVSASSR
jgi:hypothetical protein